MKKNATVIFAAVAAAFLILIGRITYINATSGYQYERNVLEQQNYDSRTIAYRRGDIIDRNGTVLATSERVYNVILDARVLLADTNEKKVESTINALCESFELEKSEIEAILEESPMSRYIILKKQVDYETGKAWQERMDAEDSMITGVWLEDDYRRIYPYNSLACDLIGFTNAGNVGSWGIERYYNDVLNGTNGREYGYLEEYSGLERTVQEAVDGSHVVTTIDTNIQNLVEQRVAAFNEEHAHTFREDDLGSKNTAVIVMDPNTGEILAMAGYPAFNLNEPRNLKGIYTDAQIEAMSDAETLDALQGLWRNYCISDTYEPGSTAKVFTVAAGLETGYLKGDEEYYCDGDKEVSGHLIHCHNRIGHGMVNLEQSIMESCNVALMDIALGLGEEEFYKYQQIFGFGQYTDIDLPGEANTSSLVYYGNNVADSDLATNSFGQNFNCTMIQMAAAYCSLINGGNYYRPYVVKEIRNNNGETISTTTPTVLKHTVTRETSETLCKYMQSTVIDGTAKNAQVNGYDIAGKTGTAEMIPREDNNYIISFAGFAPSDHPEVMVYVLVDRVNAPSQEDTSLVTTLSSQIMEDILPYMGISREEGVPEVPETEETYEEEEYWYDDSEDYSDDEWYEDDSWNEEEVWYEEEEEW